MLDSHVEPRSAPARSSGRRGFTLVELMAVVVIVGILAAVGLGGFRKRVGQAKTTEVSAMLKSIAAAQEAHRSSEMQYLDVSGNLNSALWPRSVPDGTRTTFFQGGVTALEANWRRLAPEAPRPVSFSYATVAGLPGDAFPALRASVPPPAWPTAVEPWYVVQAVGDEDADGVEAVAIATSFSDTVYWQDELE